MTFIRTYSNSGEVDSVDSLLQWAQHQQTAITSSLAESGAVLFRGFPITCAEDFDAFTQVFGYEEFTYEESLSNAVRINLTRRVFTANEAPPDVEIFLHHEMAQTPIYPSKIFFCCLSAASQGGATPLCRSDSLYQAFKSEHPDWAKQFEKLGVKYTTHMPDVNDLHSGQGRGWRSTLSVTDKVSAEARLTELGYTWNWLIDGSLTTTSPALPAVRRLSDGSESFFNQVIAAYYGWKNQTSKDKKVLTFGDDSPIDADILNTIAELAKQFTTPAEWQDGDVALIDNYRVMHGRYPYTGDRKRQVVVCLAR